MRVLGLLSAMCATGGLLACGSTSHTTSSATSHQTTAVTSTSASAPPTGCQQVAAPPLKGTQHIAAPTLKLSPAKRYVVNLATSCGPIAIQLAVKEAPKTTASFAYLVKRGFYDELTFHRVAAGFVIQGGDPNGDGSGGPGYSVVERPPADLKYVRGTVAMAKTTTDPAGASGSQFFIVTAPQAPLPPQYALVGRVVGSQAGVEAISKVPTSPAQDGTPTSPVVIDRATLSVG